MRKSVSLLAVLLLAAFSQTASAANLAEVYQAAVVNDPQLGAAKQNYAARKEVVPQARSGLLPLASIGGFSAWNERSFPASVVDTDPTSPTFGQTFNLPDDNFNEHGWQAQLTQPVFDPEAYFTYRGAKNRVQQAGHDYAATEQNLIVRVVQAYVDILRAQDLVESTRAEEAAVKRQLEQVQQRFDVGLVAITDVLEATAAFDNTEVRRIQAEGDQSIFFETLRTLTGSSYSEIDRLGANLPIVNPEPIDPDHWIELARTQNLTLLSAREQAEAAQRDLRARQSGHLPVIDVSATYNHFVTGGRSFLGGKTDTTTYRAQISLPLYQGGFTQSRVREARSRLLEAEELLRQREWSVRRDTANLLRAVSTDVVRVASRIRAIRSSESALEATQTGYEVGTRNVVDVLLAQQRLYASQFDYADSRYRYVLDLMLLKQTAGVLAAPDLEALNNYANAAQPVTRIDQLSGYRPGP
jgi:outer membrane protein